MVIAPFRILYDNIKFILSYLIGSFVKSNNSDATLAMCSYLRTYVDLQGGLFLRTDDGFWNYFEITAE